ncbi:MAG: hypothetical protein M3Y77_10540 [Actinomycetota bacterium]|nr:hypothetical protein [Actinomycetota bacterium]MDQ2958892.1 hypothetical protein [Actinomycetota bacterium]
MNNAHRAAAGAAALLTVGLVGVATADAANAQPNAARITSVQQLKASIAQAASVEQGNSTPIGTHPQGFASSIAVNKPACSA